MQVNSPYGSLEVAPKGAALLWYQWKEKPVVVSMEDSSADKWFAGHWLFPFANRLVDGKIPGFEMLPAWPLRSPEGNAGFHGLLDEVEFNWIALPNGCMGTATVESVPHYPWSFDVVVMYALGPHGLDVNFAVVNTGSASMPFQVGWHPYFAAPEGDVLTLKSTLGLVDIMPGFDGMLDLVDAQVVTASGQVVLQCDKDVQWQVFWPKGQQAMALEPILGVPGEMNEWQQLAPGENWSMNVRLLPGW